MGNCILNRVANGIPSGGAVNQVLTKNSAANGDTKWVTPSYCYIDDQGIYEGSTPIDADLLEGHDTEYFVNELGCVEIFIDEFNSLPQTVSNNLITGDSVVINSILSNPAAQTGDWTVTSTSGALEVSGTINGTTSLTMYLVNKQN